MDFFLIVLCCDTLDRSNRLIHVQRDQHLDEQDAALDGVSFNCTFDFFRGAGKRWQAGICVSKECRLLDHLGLLLENMDVQGFFHTVTLLRSASRPNLSICWLLLPLRWGST